MSAFKRAKQVFSEQLEPGLQVFSSEEEFRGAQEADIQHRATSSVSPATLAAGFFSFIPVVGPLLAAGFKAEAKSSEEEQRGREAQMFSALAERSSSMSMLGNGTGGLGGLISQGISQIGQILAARAARPATLGGALPAIGGMVGRALPAVIGAGRVAVGVGRGLLGAANRWCMRNPKTCASLGGAAVVADMMRSGEIKRPGRRMNPMNVRAMRRAIRRVKAGRKIARQIESLLPHRAAARVVHATPSRLFHARK